MDLLPPLQLWMYYEAGEIVPCYWLIAKRCPAKEESYESQMGMWMMVWIGKGKGRSGPTVARHTINPQGEGHAADAHNA